MITFNSEYFFQMFSYYFQVFLVFRKNPHHTSNHKLVHYEGDVAYYGL